ncbi:molybdopterin-dependent oxidoreductase [Hufsiella ginkgonis]|uniref:Molybdopterin-dependent oxidoreductase n=1 Tax=Hufsiella ginkgonis TaxID=2695274 RepID=A0A7K1XXS0_9SPHI|nr:molybdopterin-dependent oxidoreductase [Hufsiella ginkgonis]MXV15805.1 molybdopterin-dependent oxidoreductase [Hufsiella ginkgonis]
MNNLPKKNPKQPLTVEQQIKRRNFISFTAFAGLSVAAYGGWSWLKKSPKETPGITGKAQAPFRRALNQSELAFRNFFSRNHLVKTYPKSGAAKKVRENSHVGMKEKIDVSLWNLSVMKRSGQVLLIGLDDIKALPRTEIVFDFKCVEGWDQVQYWAGVKLIDFMDHYRLNDEAAMAYLGLETPDEKYYVGIDMDSALHPQTILAYEMNDMPLTDGHGAPLRLIIPVKYGIKNLKRIGTMTFSNERPRDYWAERGYDYYSGL